MSDTSDTVIVGFDLGHGQTALALAYAGKDAPPTVLDLPGSTGKQHVTAVAEHPTRGVLVGEVAAAARGVPSGSLKVGFKSDKFGDESVRRPIVLFVGKVVEDIRAKQLVPSDRRVRWVVGAPSGWSSKTRTAYAAVLRDAGLAHLEVIPESRAALLYARESGEVHTELNKEVLIVDIGSSTTDYTSVIGREATLVDHGNTRLGASLIDREILRQQLERHPLRARLEEIMLDDPNERLRLELLGRRVKEKYFRIPQERFRDDPDAKVSEMKEIETEDGDLDVVFRLRKADMDAVLAAPQPTLDGLSWVEAFRADLVAAVRRLDRAPNLVVLTGGPSRMDFALDVCKQTIPQAQVLRGSEPEFTIARGLALAGRISGKAAGFRTDVEKLGKSRRIDSLVQEHLPELAEAMGSAIATGVTERYIIPAFRRWRRGDIATLNQMSEDVSRQVNDGLQAGDTVALSAATVNWQNKLLPALEELTRPICRRWGIPADALTLPAIEMDGSRHHIHVDTTEATSTLNAIGNSMTLVVGVIGGTILGGGGTALFIAGPVGWIIGAVAAVAFAAYGKEAAMEKAKSTNIPVIMRKLKGEQSMIENLRKKAPVSEPQLASVLAAKFLTDSGDKLADGVVRGIVAQLEERAAEAEFLIS